MIFLCVVFYRSVINSVKYLLSSDTEHWLKASKRLSWIYLKSVSSLHFKVHIVIVLPHRILRIRWVKTVMNLPDT